MHLFLIQDSFCYAKFVIMSWSRRTLLKPNQCEAFPTQNKKILLHSHKNYCNNEKSVSVY